MGDGAAGSAELSPSGLMVSKMLACFTRAKLLKISAFLLSAVCAATALLDSGIAPVVRKYSGKHEAQQSAFQPQEGHFGVLHSKNLGQNHTQIQRRHSLAQHRSQGEQMFGEDDFFHHPVIDILGHR